MIMKKLNAKKLVRYEFAAVILRNAKVNLAAL